MTPRDFIYWLNGYLQQGGPDWHIPEGFKPTVLANVEKAKLSAEDDSDNLMSQVFLVETFLVNGNYSAVRDLAINAVKYLHLSKDKKTTTVALKPARPAHYAMSGLAKC